MTTYEYKRLLVQLLESSVDFLVHKRSQTPMDKPEYLKMTKELAAAQTELYKARAGLVNHG